MRTAALGDPYLEDGHVLLVEALDAAGQKDEARHAYDRYQRIVRSELHAQPREELARRYESGAPTGHGLPLDELVPLGTITMHVVDWSGERRRSSASTAVRGRRTASPPSGSDSLPTCASSPLT